MINNYFLCIIDKMREKKQLAAMKITGQEKGRAKLENKKDMA